LRTIRNNTLHVINDLRFQLPIMITLSFPLIEWSLARCQQVTLQQHRENSGQEPILNRLRLRIAALCYTTTRYRLRSGAVSSRVALTHAGDGHGFACAYGSKDLGKAFPVQVAQANHKLPHSSVSKSPQVLEIPGNHTSSV
jgi:hypothetical protein